MRICTFPLNYVDSLGNDKVIHVDESDYSKYISGEKSAEEAFGHYLDKDELNEIIKYDLQFKNHKPLNS